jgi:hypothetical protein
VPPLVRALASAVPASAVPTLAVAPRAVPAVVDAGPALPASLAIGVPIQTPVASPASVLATVALSALFISLTAFVAARNVLGDVNPVKALGIGPGPAVLSTLPETFGINPFLALGAAILVDAAGFYLLYDRTPRLVAYMTLIHAVVTIIAGAILFGLLALISSAPT